MQSFFDIILSFVPMLILFLYGCFIAYKSLNYRAKYKNFFNFLWQLPKTVFK